MSQNPSFTFKQNKDKDMLGLIHPALLLIFADFNLYAHRRNLPVTITRVIDERIPNVSVSDTHAEGRAIDLSTLHWGQDDIDQVCLHFNTKYRSYGTSQTGLNPRVCVYHEGVGFHIHLQIRRGL